MDIQSRIHLRPRAASPLSRARAASPASSDPAYQPSEHYLFFLTVFPDGTAVASWHGGARSEGAPLLPDRSHAQAYLPNANLFHNGQILRELVRDLIAASPVPYWLNIQPTVMAQKPPQVFSIQTPASETATLDKLRSQLGHVRQLMIQKKADLAAGTLPPPPPAQLFDERGQPLRQFFRVREYETDSNFDGFADHLQFGTGQNPFNQDIDNDGIPNGYDINIWTADRSAETHKLLESVLINEVLLSNEFTNADNYARSSDWIELYNPTNTTLNLSGWFLSDRADNLTRWAFPADAEIPSGAFLVVWASNQNNTGTGPLHTNFELDAGNPDVTPQLAPDPVFLTRRKPDNTVEIVDSFQPGIASFGGQRTDVSFGRYPSSDGLKTGYMVVPTPGANGTRGPVGQHNVVGALGFTPPPIFAGGSSPPGLYENQQVTAVLQAASNAAIHFTTNSANPTRYSELYGGPLVANRTLVIRAIAAQDGYIPSRSVTRSYLFKEDILGTAPQGTTPTNHQGARDAQGQFTGRLRGYPEATDTAGLPILYGMDAGTIRNHRTELSNQLSAAPVVSVVATVQDFFDEASAGVYPNSSKTDTIEHITVGQPDPRGRNWERHCSFEFIEANRSAHTQTNAVVQITGGSSIATRVTRKHNLRIEFDANFGVDELNYPLLPEAKGANGSTITLFKSFHLKNPTHDSWSNTYGRLGAIFTPAENDGDARDNYRVSQVASYCNEAFVKAAHQRMGYTIPQSRWVHLFINGIYWGPYQLTERVDRHFMSSHFERGASQYTVVKQAPESVGGAEAIDGNVADWFTLVSTCQAVATASDKPAQYAIVQTILDVDSYIDYVICNTYAGNDDWCLNNWRAARRNQSGAKWQFFIWDAEWSLLYGEHIDFPGRTDGYGGDRPANPNWFWVLDCTGPMKLHDALLSHEPYRTAFDNRIKRHFFLNPQNSSDPTWGALAVPPQVLTDRAVELFRTQTNIFRQVLYCESSRWGYMDSGNAGKTTPFTLSEPSYLPGKPYGDWQRNTDYRLNTWLPLRRAYYLSKMQAANLYRP